MRALAVISGAEKGSSQTEVTAYGFSRSFRVVIFFTAASVEKVIKYLDEHTSWSVTVTIPWKEILLDEGARYYG